MPCRNMSAGRRRLRGLLRRALRRRRPDHRRPARPAGRARRRRCSRTATASRPASSSSTACSCPGSGCSWPANGSTRRHLTYSYATHHRHTCIAARAGFGDLLIGAGALMCEANGFDPGKETPPARADGPADLDRRGLLRLRRRRQRLRHRRIRAPAVVTPMPVFANIGKLLLANQIYEMQRIAHYVSGGLIVTLPGPGRGPQPRDRRRNLADVLRANPDVPYDKRIQAARFLEDLTASYQGGWYSVISLHGGGSPAAMKQEIWRNYPVGNKVELVERLLNRGLLHDPTRPITANRQPGRCCDSRLHAAGAGDDHGARLPSCPSPEEPTADETDRSRTAYADFHRRSIDERDAFWAEQAAADRLADAVRRRSATTAGRRSRAGSSAARPTCATTRSTATWPTRARPAGADLRLDRDRQRADLQLRRTARRGAAHGRDAASRWASAQGDRVLIYMPMIPEAAFAMLACARIGAIHSVVFGGFASGQPGHPHRRRRAEGDRQRRRRLARRQGGARTSRCSTRRSAWPAHKPAKVLLVDRGLAPMELVAGPRPRLRRAARAAPATPQVPCAWLDCDRHRATPSTPAAPPAGRRACSATPAATRWRWRPA